MENTIEQQVAETILQGDHEIQVGDKTYRVAPPSVATLILVSKEISRMPSGTLNGEKIMEETLSIAKDCTSLGDIAATLILGAKHINDTEEVLQTQKKRRFRGLFSTTKTTTRTVSKKATLSAELLENLSPRELQNIIVQALTKMQVADFFGITTFLTEINLIRPTKVETAPTASGQ